MIIKLIAFMYLILLLLNSQKVIAQGLIEGDFKKLVQLPQRGEAIKSKRICVEQVREISFLGETKYKTSCSRFKIERVNEVGTLNVLHWATSMGIDYDTLISHPYNINQLRFRRLVNDSTFLFSNVEFSFFKAYTSNDTLQCVWIKYGEFDFFNSELFALKTKSKKFSLDPYSLFNEILINSSELDQKGEIGIDLGKMIRLYKGRIIPNVN